jgi:hypothetical protein
MPLLVPVPGACQVSNVEQAKCSTAALAANEPMNIQAPNHASAEHSNFLETEDVFNIFGSPYFVYGERFSMLQSLI